MSINLPHLNVLTTLTGESRKVCQTLLENSNNDIDSSLKQFFSTQKNQPLELSPIFGIFHGQNQIPISGISIRAQVTDLIADIKVSQRFSNIHNDPIEAILKFRQHRAVLYGFNICVDGKKIKGKCKEKEEAKAAYDDALASGNSAFLASTGTDDVFKINIGNLPPKAECIVIFKYLLPLEFRENRLIIPFPISTLPLNNSDEIPSESAFIEDYRKKVPKGFSLNVTLETSSAIIRRVQCYTYEINSKIISDQKAEIDVFSPTIGLNLTLFAYLDQVNELSCVIESNPKSPEQGALMLSFSPGNIMTKDDVLNEIIFLVDRSGSMTGNRISQAKSALQFFLRSIPIGSLVNIWGFGTHFDILFQDGSVEFNDKILDQTSAFVSNMDADLGGTDILPPLQLLLSNTYKNSKNLPRQIFILTDGGVNNTDNVLKYVQQNINESTRIFSVGIGAASEALVSGIAQNGNGNAVYVRAGVSIQEVVMEQLQSALRPIIQNVEVDWGSLPVVKRPFSHPPIFSDCSLTIFTFLKSIKDISPKEVIKVTGNTGKTSFKWELPVHTKEIKKGTTIHRLTAKDIIKVLEKDNEKNKKQILDISLEWNIASKHTAFIAVNELSEATQSPLKVIKIDESSLPVPIAAPSARLRNVDHNATINYGNNMFQSFTRYENIELLLEKSEDLSFQSKKFTKSASSLSFSFLDTLSSIGSSLSDTFSNIFSSPEPTSSSNPIYQPHGSDSNNILKSESLSRDYPTSHYLSTLSSSGFTLDNFILLQRASGYFPLNSELEGHLNKSHEEILNSIPEELKKDKRFDNKQKEEIWATLLAIVHLELRYGNRNSEWQMLSSKAQKYISNLSISDSLLLSARTFLSK